MTKQTKPDDLEQRAARGLSANGDSNLSFAEFNSLVEEITTAIAEAEAAAEDERQRALDPAISPDPKEARERMEAASFRLGRLRTLLPRLKARSMKAWEHERRARWRAEFDRLKAEQDELLEQYDAIDADYREASARRDQLLDRMEDCDRDAGRVNHDASELPNEHRRLEMLFEPAAAVRRPPDWRCANSFAASYAQAAPPVADLSGIGPNWSDPNYQKARREALERRQAEMAAYHEQAAKAQEERLNKEERERFAQQQQRRG